jgi:hypothetical protein
MTARCDRPDPGSATAPRGGTALTPAGLTFAACYAYSPRGHGMASEESRLLRARLKAGDVDWIARYAARVQEQSLAGGRLSGLFGTGVVLVPMPPSACTGSGAAGATVRLAVALRNAGLACAVWAGLRRIVPIRKSATAPCRCRPSVQAQFDSLAVDGTLLAPAQLMLVDDVVTKGRTLLAGAQRLREAFPGAQVQGFALLRTMSMVPEIERLLDPCLGTIFWKDADAWRSP